MGYPEPIKAAVRKIADNVVTVSCPFTIANKYEVGARMSLVDCNGTTVAYLPVPYGPYVDEALALLGATKIDVLVVANSHHTLGVASNKEKFPELEVVASEKVHFDFDFCSLTLQQSNEVLGASRLASLVPRWPATVLLVYLSHHKNKEVVMYDSVSKTLFEGDVVFNIGGACSGSFEQYLTASGFPANYNPLTWWSFPFRSLYPGGYLGRWMHRRVNVTDSEDARAGLEVVNGLDFETIVPCHGNVMEGGKAVFREVFPFLK